MMAEKGQQARRLVYMLKKFQAGHKYTAKEMQELIEENFGAISLKSIQRDLNLLQECEPTLENIKQDGRIVWRIPKGFRSTPPIRVTANEALSYYILKAHLRAFKGTIIESYIDELYEKIQELAPGEPFSKDSLIWDQNYGQFDYSEHDEIIQQVIYFINNKKWAHVRYKRGISRKYNNFICIFEKMFTYSGSLYVSVYVPYHGNHIALKIERIIFIEESESQDYKHCEFDFNKFKKDRFGVYYGDKKQVELKVRKGYEIYFENRKWHPSQKISKNKKGEMIIKLRVPIVPDFVGWLMSWSEVLTVIKPVSLIKDINIILRNTLKQYE